MRRINARAVLGLTTVSSKTSSAAMATKNARFSYLPLLTIPAAGRDGRIRRVLLAELFGSGGRNAEAVARRLSGASLVEENTGEIKADLRRAETSPRKGIVGRYVAESTVWGSVTPVVLPGRDDYRQRKAHGLILKALAQAGYTTPILEIQLQEEPVFPGAERARAYRAPAYLKQYPRTHAIITFAKPVRGPVAIGGGRHVGLGTFATLSASN
jgi:CRISPR-associated protein Csb2